MKAIQICEVTAKVRNISYGGSRDFNLELTVETDKKTFTSSTYVNGNDMESVFDLVFADVQRELKKCVLGEE